VPRLRLLADLAAAQASGVSAYDPDGNSVYDVAPGNLIPVNLDATGWAGADSVASSAWESADGATLSSRTLSGSVASCNAYIPDDAVRRSAYRVRNTLTLSTGPTRSTTVWLRAVSR
jgi:hypothetical protein